MMTSSFRLSNAKAKHDLGWTLSAPTYREGIARTVRALASPHPYGTEETETQTAPRQNEKRSSGAAY
jgi:hypothetical protein